MVSIFGSPGLAEQQHGVVSRQQLLALGMTEEAVDVRLEAGRLDAVLSHRSAAALWGIRAHSSRAIEVTAPAKSRSRGGIQRHFALLPGDEVTVERGIAVTTVPRTIFDLAAVASVDAVENALRQSEYLRLHDRLSLPDLLERYPRRQGAKAIRECLATQCLARGGREAVSGRLPWPRQRVVVEFDGFAAPGTRAAFREDRARDRRLRVAGYGVTRVAREQLEDEAEALAADLRTLLVA